MSLPVPDSITWKQYVDFRFQETKEHNEQVRALLVDFNNRERAAMEVRLDGLNHLQRRLDTLVATLVSQTEHDLSVQRLQTEIQAENRRQAEAIAALNEKIGVLQRFQTRVAAIGATGLFVVGLLEFILPHFVK